MQEIIFCYIAVKSQWRFLNSPPKLFFIDGCDWTTYFLVHPPPTIRRRSNPPLQVSACIVIYGGAVEHVWGPNVTIGCGPSPWNEIWQPAEDLLIADAVNLLGLISTRKTQLFANAAARCVGTAVHEGPCRSNRSFFHRGRLPFKFVFFFNVFIHIIW